MKSVKVEVALPKRAPRALIRVWMGETAFTLASQKSALFFHGLQGLVAHFRRERGVILPPLELTLGRELAPDCYAIELCGRLEAPAELRLGRRLAVGDDDVLEKLIGEPGFEPVYGMRGRWIMPSQGELAQQLGCFVAEPEALLVSHLMERLYGRLSELVTSRSVETLLDELAEEEGALVKAVRERFTVAKLRKVFRMLTDEHVSLADLTDILEAMVACDGKSGHDLLAAARQALARHIVAPLKGPGGALPAITLAEWVERKWQTEIKGDGPIEPWFCQLFLDSLAAELAQLELDGVSPALIVDADLRWTLARMVERAHRELAVLSWSEIPPDCAVDEVAVLGSRLSPLTGSWPGFHRTVDPNASGSWEPQPAVL